jgi:PAS domain S-box-containing protein
MQRFAVDNVDVRHILDLIDRQYADVVTLRTLSTSVGRQPAYLGRLFRQEVGSSFHDYLTLIRMKHAAKLIQDGVKVEAVALCVGYRSKKNFYQQFRKHYGTTPVPYRCRCLESDTPGGATASRLATLSDTASQPVRTSQPIQNVSSDAEPPLGGLASILRATNRAWHLAVRAQELLVQKSGRLQMGILLTGNAGRYITANRAALDVTGYSATELNNLSPAELFVQGPKAETRCVWQFLLSRPNQADREPNATVRTKTGNCVSVHLVTLRNLLTERHGTAVLGRVAAAAR